MLAAAVVACVLLAVAGTVAALRLTSSGSAGPALAELITEVTEGVHRGGCASGGSSDLRANGRRCRGSDQDGFPGSGTAPIAGTSAR